MPSVYIKTYGCQMNERDSEAVAAQLVAKGYALAPSEAVADVILLVVTYMQASIANTRAAVDTFEALGYKGQKPILLVVNQSDSTAGMSKGGIEHTLNLPVVGEIPTDWKTVAESLNKQQPFVLSSPNSAVSKAIDALANALVQQQRR